MGAVKFETDATCASGQTILHSAGSLRALSYFPDCRVHVSWTRVFVSDYFSILSADRRQQAGKGDESLLADAEAFCSHHDSRLLSSDEISENPRSLRRPAHHRAGGQTTVFSY